MTEMNNRMKKIQIKFNRSLFCYIQSYLEVRNIQYRLGRQVSEYLNNICILIKDYKIHISYTENVYKIIIWYKTKNNNQFEVSISNNEIDEALNELIQFVNKNV